jgi:hypothetical protein
MEQREGGMGSLDDLLERLERAGEEGWEAEYASVSVEVSREQAGDIVCSGRAFSSWFAFRYDAGPPGVALPAFQDAVSALLSRSGAPLDAYCVLFSKEPIREDAPAQLLLALLCNGASCALQQGPTWLATWMAARAGIAAIAMGMPERAWLLLDGLTINGERHPHLDKLAMFEALRGNSRLERNGWIRAAIMAWWPRLKVPAIPRLPREALDDTIELPIEETFEELTRAGAVGVKGLLEATLNAADRVSLQLHDDDPLVHELRLRSMTPGAAPPDVAELPAWFVAWARSIRPSKDPYLARMAGLMLARCSPEHAQLAAALVLPGCRAADLDVLLAALDPSEAREHLVELVATARSLRTPLADALVAASFFEHHENLQGQLTLSRHLEELVHLTPIGSGIVEATLTMVREISADMRRDKSEAAPSLDRLLASVRAAVGRLRSKDHLLVADVERAISSVEVPPLTQGLLESLDSYEHDPLDRLILSLTVGRALRGTEQDAWIAPTLKTASDALFELRMLSLFPMRLQLLSELIEREPPTMSLAQLYFERANTRRAMAPHDSESTEVALSDFTEAMRRSVKEVDAKGCAHATAAWIKLLVWLSIENPARLESSFDEAHRAIDRTLSLPLGSFEQAVLHQARAHLLRTRSPQASIEAFDVALGFLSPADAFWVELAAELVATMVRAGRFEEAAVRGQAYLEQVSIDTKSIERGMLHLSVGEAMAEIGRWIDARDQLEAGIDLVRGGNAILEAHGRMQLVRLGMSINGKPSTSGVASPGSTS